MSDPVAAKKPKAIRTLIADDSLFMRHTLKRALESDSRIAVIGEARDGEEAIAKNVEEKPDVIVLDVEMPRLDGLAALSQIMSQRPVPVVMFSSLTHGGAQVTLEALSLGAVDFLPKPQSTARFGETSEELCRKVVAAASARLRVRARRTFARPASAGNQRGLAADTTTLPSNEGFSEAKSLVVIGSSTGGPQALDDVIPSLPSDLESCVLICQHMPAGFTSSMAKRLDSVSSLPVREVSERESVPSGTVLVAPGGCHLKILSRHGGRSLRFVTDDGAPVHGVRPAVDVTLYDAAPIFKDRLMAVILTGMGIDGAEGAKAAKALGATVIAQDESTSVVWGMPRACYEMGICDKVLPLGGIADEIARFSATIGERA